MFPHGTIVDSGVKHDLIHDKSSAKLNIWNGNAHVWVKEADVTRHSPLAWPGFHPVDGGSGSSAASDAFFDQGEGGIFFADVYDKIWSVSEMKNATSDDKKYASMKGLVCRYPSEWQTDDAMVKWQKVSQYVSDADKLQKTKDFIKDLTFWYQVAAKVPGFPSVPTVWHFHPGAFFFHVKADVGVQRYPSNERL